MTFADRIRTTTATTAVLFCISLVSPVGALAAPPEQGAGPGNSAAAHDKKDQTTGVAITTTTAPAPDESTIVALESSGATSSGSNGSGSNGTGGGSSSNPNAGGANSNGKKAASTDPTSTTTSTSTSGNGGGNGNGNGGGNGNNGGGGGNANGGGGGNSTIDPDPAPVGTPPSTTGPNTCDGGGKQQGGPYDHDNCDGTQGQHGNGGNGKCAGCTGKGDDKGPRGQYPGDNNNGYECDHNRGVGKGNPAHSKCKPKTDNDCKTNCSQCTTNCESCQTNCSSCQTNCNPGCQTDCNPGCQVDCTPGCQEDCNPSNPGCQGPTCDPDEVLGKMIHQALPKTQSVLPAQVRSAALPFTGAGSSLVPLMTLGMLLMAIGGLAMATSTRRRKATRLI